MPGHRGHQSVQPLIIALVCLMTGAIAAVSAQADQTTSKPAQEIVGIWLGTLEAGGVRARVVLKISKNADRALVATMDSPDRGRKDLAVTQISWQNGSLHLEGVGDRVFDGILSQDGQEIVGQWQQPPYKLPLTLRHVEQAPVVVTPSAAGLYIAAVITSLLSLLLIGYFILGQTPRKDWRFFAAVMAMHLPMSAIAFHWIRLPMDRWLAATLGHDSPALYGALVTLYAPVTEEFSKLWLLLVPWFVRRLRKENAPHLGMAIGLGFGIGEAWMIAGLLSTDLVVASSPWYLLGGYINERFMVCVHHGAFTAAALRTVRQAPVRSILFAMALHFIGNFPLALRGWNFGGLGAPAWSVIVPIWIILFFFAMIALLIRFFKAAAPEGRWSLRHFLLGQAKCPECGLVYQRSWFAVNIGNRRYERCPGCKKWHVTTTWKGEASQQTRT